MVSVRKAWRKLMGLSTGHGTSVGPQHGLPNSGDILAKRPRGTNPVSVYPMPHSEAEQPPPININKSGTGAFNVSASSFTIEQHDQQISGIKRRKPHKRKVAHDRQPCVMRGVYFKNMKWQAAIKVEKKQIHLGTVGTQEEAAHLYDRAAFMCGREPNFEITEEEKQELMKLNWDEFLALTRHTINTKKHRRRRQAGAKKVSEAQQLSNGIGEDEQEISNTSASED
ncbi:unnamed protein product [Rhodiola kirilowii]